MPTRLSKKDEKTGDGGKDPAAVALGRKGGMVRAGKLTPEERSKAARLAARARWAKKAAVKVAAKLEEPE